MSCQKQLRKGGTSSGSKGKATVHHGWRVTAIGPGASRLHCALSQEAESDECFYLSHSLGCQDPSPGMVAWMRNTAPAPWYLMFGPSWWNCPEFMKPCWRKHGFRSLSSQPVCSWFSLLHVCGWRWDRLAFCSAHLLPCLPCCYGLSPSVSLDQ